MSALPVALPVLAHAIPAVLKERDQWVAWKLLTRAGKPTKIPINPDMGSFAQVDCPSTWGSFDQARNRQRNDSLAGIGFVFSPMDPFCGLDFDKCRDADTQAIETEARAMLGLLDSYAEVSPSGTGMHVIVRAALPGDRNRIGRVEIYDTLRFLTITGHRLTDGPATINDRQPQLDTLYRRLFGEPETRPAPADSTIMETTLPGDALWRWAYPRLSARMMRVANLDDAQYNGDASGGDAGLACALVGLGLTRSEVDAAFRASPRGPALVVRKGENRLDYLIEHAVNAAASFVGEGKII